MLLSLKVSVSVMVYKALNHMAPEYITDIVTNVSETHKRSTLSFDNDLLHTPSFKDKDKIKKLYSTSRFKQTT